MALASGTTIQAPPTAGVPVEEEETGKPLLHEKVAGDEYQATAEDGEGTSGRGGIWNRPKIGPIRMLGINAFMFGYGLWLASFAIVTLPKESANFFPKKHDLALAGYIGIAGVSQLSGPGAGMLSDRLAHDRGRRRPVLIGASLVEGPLLCALWLCRQFHDSAIAAGMYFVVFFFTMLALNVMYTAASGLIPDIVHPEQLGKANGYMAALQALGAFTGLLFTFLHPQVGALYPFYMSVLAIVVPVTSLSAQEYPSSSPSTRFSWRSLLRCYWIDRKQGDFFWLFVCRTLYYCGISIQFFSQDLLRDLVSRRGHDLNGSDPEKYAAYLSAIGQICGAAGAYPAGLLSDRTGRKPIVAAACLGICGIYVGFMIARQLDIFIGLGAALGLFNGCYLSVDYALAVDTLPDRTQAARWLAIWSVASALPFPHSILSFFFGF